MNKIESIIITQNQLNLILTKLESVAFTPEKLKSTLLAIREATKEERKEIGMLILQDIKKYCEFSNGEVVISLENWEKLTRKYGDWEV